MIQKIKIKIPDNCLLTVQKVIADEEIALTDGTTLILSASSAVHDMMTHLLTKHMEVTEDKNKRITILKCQAVVLTVEQFKDLMKQAYEQGCEDAIVLTN